jgi:hypothetical protein
MRGDHQDVVAIGPVDNPKHAIAERGDRLVGSRPLRVSWITLDSVRTIDGRFDPGRIDLPQVDRLLRMLAQPDHDPSGYSRR